MTMTRSFPLVVSCVLALCLSSAVTAHAQPVIERQVIVQASVGQPGREFSFLILQNLEDEPIEVTVEYLGETGALAVRTYQLTYKERRAVNVIASVPQLGPQAYFSVVAYFPADVAGATAMAWHRATDLAQVDSVAAVLRSSTKR